MVKPESSALDQSLLSVVEEIYQAEEEGDGVQPFKMILRRMMLSKGQDDYKIVTVGEAEKSQKKISTANSAGVKEQDTGVNGKRVDGTTAEVELDMQNVMMKKWASRARIKPPLARIGKANDLLMKRFSMAHILQKGVEMRKKDDADNNWEEAESRTSREKSSAKAKNTSPKLEPKEELSLKEVASDAADLQSAIMDMVEEAYKEEHVHNPEAVVDFLAMPKNIAPKIIEKTTLGKPQTMLKLVSEQEIEDMVQEIHDEGVGLKRTIVKQHTNLVKSQNMKGKSEEGEEKHASHVLLVSGAHELEKSKVPFSGSIISQGLSKSKDERFEQTESDSDTFKRTTSSPTTDNSHMLPGQLSDVSTPTQSAVKESSSSQTHISSSHSPITISSGQAKLRPSSKTAMIIAGTGISHAQGVASLEEKEKSLLPQDLIGKDLHLRNQKNESPAPMTTVQPAQVQSGRTRSQSKPTHGMPTLGITETIASPESSTTSSTPRSSVFPVASFTSGGMNPLPQSTESTTAKGTVSTTMRSPATTSTSTSSLTSSPTVFQFFEAVPGVLPIPSSGEAFFVLFLHVLAYIVNVHFKVVQRLREAYKMDR